mgnify:CR=1 FL=1
MKKTLSALLVGGLFAAANVQATPVELELSLVIDVSGSISATEYDLQRAGYAAAFGNAAVVNGILSYADGIAVNVVQFASNAAEVVSWTHLTDAASISAFANTMANLARSGSIGSNTDVEDGMSTGRASFASNGYEGRRLVMDVSGDGTQNEDPDCGAKMTYCRVTDALPGPPTVCGRGWDPAASAEAQALATVGSLAHGSYGERRLMGAVDGAFDSNLGLSDEQLSCLMHQGGAP